MATSLADVDSDEWTDPNLTEPKFQDDLHRRLNEDARKHRHQRPKAARYELKPSLNVEDTTERQPLRIRYFKYIPYQGMSEPDRRKYLNLEGSRLASCRTEPTPRRQERGGAESSVARKQPQEEAAFWPSASKAKSLKVYDYHLAELSMTYRSHPSLLGVPRKISTPTNEEEAQRHQRQEARRSLFYQLHTNRSVPASAPTVTQRTLAEKTTQVSRGCTPLFESAVSENFPTEPGDVVSKSDSNRLLNVVSVDECHILHRRRRRRLRRVSVQRDPINAAQEGDCHLDQSYDEEEEYDEEEVEGDWEERRTDRDEDKRLPDHALETASIQTEQPDALLVDQPANRAAQLSAADHRESDPDAALAFIQSGAASTRPSTERRKVKRRSEKEMRQLAAAKFLRRNEILREKMAIYLDWKLNRERMGLTDIREGDPATRFERFTVELVRQEAQVANQYRGGAGDGGGGGSQTDTLALGEGGLPDGFSTSPVAAASPRIGDHSRPEQLSLTAMFEALKV